MSYHQPQTSSENSYNNRAAPTMHAQQAPQAQPHRNSHVQAGASQSESGMASMINSFAQAHINLQSANMQAAANAMSPVNSPQYIFLHDGRIGYIPPANVFPAQSVATTHLPEGAFAYPELAYASQAAYPGYLPGYPMMPYAQARQDLMHNDVPGLDKRRGSYSTNESAPGTPFYGSLGHHDHGIIIAGSDRSPIYSTPSPQISHNINIPMGKPLPYKSIPINFDIDALLQQHPAIPHAVPAVFTPRESMRTLEQSLSNPIYGNRNVYIRGLHPDTNDETLAAYAARFGRVETSKAIIDTSTGACKGFGFAKYFDVRDSETCIRGFYKLGYEVGFARESFNSRLKAKGDQSSTNLYVSNLPKDMNEMELAAIFMDYNVVSSRILHDSQGNSRGVGFARFESRDICEEIIKKFHGQPIGEEGLLLQVRYADTPAQKDLKKITTERRQFRTTEYNVSAYGSPADLMSLSPEMSSPGVSRMAQISRHLPESRSSGSWKRGESTSASSVSVGESPVPGSAFKDLDTRTSKIVLTPRKPAEDSKQQPGTSTPTVSDDGSADEGATILGVTPGHA